MGLELQMRMTKRLMMSFDQARIRIVIIKDRSKETTMKQFTRVRQHITSHPAHHIAL